MKPLCIDLFCGLGGWTEGFLATGWDVVGFDIEQHVYGAERYPAQLVVQDVLTLHGSQFKSADCLVCSPPCQEYSYMAMPWTRAKARAAAIRADTTGAEIERLNRLFDACFRIQREACEAAGRHIPMVCENVRGAQPWVGPARWSFGSYFLWGDVPALMPPTTRMPKFILDDIKNGQRRSIDGLYDDGLTVKVPGFRFDGSGRSFQTASVAEHIKKEADLKQGGTWFHDATSASRTSSSKSPARKAASAKIAKIPFALSSWIGKVYLPREVAA